MSDPGRLGNVQQVLLEQNRLIDLLRDTITKMGEINNLQKEHIDNQKQMIQLQAEKIYLLEKGKENQKNNR